MSKPKLPSLCHHKKTNRGFAVLKGQWFYFGHWPANRKTAPFEVLSAYSEWCRRLSGSQVEEAHSQKRPSPLDLRVCQLADAYITWAEGNYKESGEAKNIAYSLVELVQVAGEDQVTDFTPRRLKAVRDQMVARGRSRQGVNKVSGIIRRCFKWGVEEGWVPILVYQALAITAPLRRGQTEAPESNRTEFVDDETIDRTLPHLPPAVAALVRLGQFSGGRPSELCRITTGAIDMADDAVWFYEPARHKTANRGRKRMIALGARCQEILRPWLRPDEPDMPLFSPIEERTKRLQELRAKRKTKVQPSQTNRAKSQPLVVPGAMFCTRALATAIRRVCLARGIPVWSPGRLRKTHAQRIYRAVGLEETRACLGHAGAEVTTAHYLSFEKAHAKKAAVAVG